jgi:hypothetical protein
VEEVKNKRRNEGEKKKQNRREKNRIEEALF